MPEEEDYSDLDDMDLDEIEPDSGSKQEL